MRLRICHIETAAADRPAGYLEAVLSVGVRDGDWLEMKDEDYRALVERFRPSAEAMVGGITKAALRWVSGGMNLAPEALAWERSAVCALCPLWDARGRRCLQCGCTGLKHHLPAERCPLDRW